MAWKKPTQVTGGGGGGGGGVSQVSGTSPITVTNNTTTPQVSIADATTTTKGAMTATDKTKLDGIQTGATANATDAQLRDRSTHTGTQAIESVQGLQTALDGKAAATHSHAIADTTGLQAALDGKASATHSHAIADTTGLQTALDGKAAATHSHAIADTTGLQTALDGKASTTHSHAIADTTGLQAALDGKASTTHSHAIADTTGLQAALDGKQASLGFTPENAANKGQANGYAGLDATGKVPSAQLPTDVIEVANAAALPGTGATNTIYIIADTNKLYRWNSTSYVEITSGGGGGGGGGATDTDGLPEGVLNKYFTEDRVRGTALTGLSTTTNSAVTATDSVLQAAGKLQAQINDKANTSHSHAIADTTGLQSALDGKASTTHSHAIADTTGLQAALDGKASTTHTHAIADTTGLQSALDGKASTTHNHAIADVTNLQTTLDGKASTSHNHTIADTTGLQTALDGKASTTHNHAIADVTNLQTALDGKASTTHNHAIADVTNLQTALDGKANATHNHAIADVTNLQTALDGKASTSHNHTIADTTGLQTALDGKASTTHNHAIADVTGLQTALDSKQASLGFTPENAANKGQANGYASLDAQGRVPSSQLPSFVDDVLEFNNLAALPVTGETAKIYVTLDNNRVFRWSGSAYVEISASPGSTDSVTEGATNLYFTETRVRNTALTGLSTATNSAITATDSVLQAAGKLQAQVNAKANTTHGHVIADVTGLQTALDAKSDTTHTHNVATTTVAGFMSSADKTKLDGVASGATANATDAQLRDRSTHTGTQAISTVTNLQTSLDGKANATHTHVIGDVTNLQTALDGKANTTHTHTISNVTGLQTALDAKSDTTHTHSNATTTVAGFMSSTDKTKLDGVASGATANATDAQLRDRSTHTGTQAISTVTNLQTSLDGKATTTSLTQTRDFSTRLQDGAMVNLFGANGDFKVGVNNASPEGVQNFSFTYNSFNSKADTGWTSRQVNSTPLANYIDCRFGEWSFTAPEADAFSLFTAGRVGSSNGSQLNPLQIQQNKFYVFVAEIRATANVTLIQSVETLAPSFVANRQGVNVTSTYQSFGIRYASGTATRTEVTVGGHTAFGTVAVGETIATRRWRLYEVTQAEYDALAGLSSTEIGTLYPYTEPSFQIQKNVISSKNLIKGELQQARILFNQGLENDIFPRDYSFWSLEAVVPVNNVMTLQASTNRLLSRNIPVVQGQRILISSNIFVLMATSETVTSIFNYNTSVNKVEWSAVEQTVVIPSGVNFIRLALRADTNNSNWTNAASQFVEIARTAYLVVVDTKPNLISYNPSDWEWGSLFGTGEPAENVSQFRFKGFIPVSEGQRFYASKNVFIVMYTAANNNSIRNYGTTTDFLDWSSNTQYLVIPANITHIKILLRQDGAAPFSTNEATRLSELKALIYNYLFVNPIDVHPFHVYRDYGTGKIDARLRIRNNHSNVQTYQAIDVKPNTRYTFSAQGDRGIVYLSDNPRYSTRAAVNLIQGESEQNALLFNQGVDGGKVFVSGKLRINSNAHVYTSYQEINVKPNTNYIFSAQGEKVTTFLSDRPSLSNSFVSDGSVLTFAIENGVTPSTRHSFSVYTTSATQTKIYLSFGFYTLNNPNNYGEIWNMQLEEVVSATKTTGTVHRVYAPEYNVSPHVRSSLAYTTGTTQTKLYLSFGWYDVANTNKYGEIWNMQLEEGSTATPFSPNNVSNIVEKVRSGYTTPLKNLLGEFSRMIDHDGNGVANGFISGLTTNGGIYSVVNGRQRIMLDISVNSSGGSRYVSFRTNQLKGTANELRENKFYIVAADVETGGGSNFSLQIINNDELIIDDKYLVITTSANIKRTVFALVASNIMKNLSIDFYNMGSIGGSGYVDIFNFRIYELTTQEYCEALTFSESDINTWYPYVPDTPIRVENSTSTGVTIKDTLQVVARGNVQLSNPDPLTIIRSDGNPNFVRVRDSNSAATTSMNLLLMAGNAAGRCDISSRNQIDAKSPITFNAGDLVLASDGVVGVRATTRAWNSDYASLDVGANGSIAGRISTSNTLDVSSNVYRHTSGEWRYINTDAVARLSIDGSAQGLYLTTAASGTAGTAVTFTNTMSITNNLASFNGAISANGLVQNVTTVTATTTLTNSNFLVLANATSGAITINLPAASASSGRMYIIKKTDSSANAVTIDPSGAETIDGAATQSITTQNQVVRVVCNGTSWFVI